MKAIIQKPETETTGLIALCFLLTSIGWLSWEYHLLDQVSTGISDVCTMVAGYLLQAAGIGIFVVLCRKRPSQAQRLFPAALILHMVCLFLAVLSPYYAGTLVFGFFLNVLCGFIAGCYLYALTTRVPGGRRASAFGAGYGIAILASWLLSRIGGGAFYYTEKVLVICLVITAAVLWMTVRGRGKAADPRAEDTDGEPGRAVVVQKNPAKRSFLILAAVLVILFSIVNSSGFAFPTADLGQGVNIELSRLIYAAGLVAAGYLTDKNRKYGAVCALTALMIPFVILALRGEMVPSILFWLLSYFTFGFYSVYRIVLFSDIAEEKGLLFLSGFGLLGGRIGDAIGEGICILFSGRLTLMVIITAVLFAAAVAVFFKLYQILYVPEMSRQQSEKERFAQFSMAHDLSAREQDMLRMLLEKNTNAEIADILSISENTVKFHVRNLLQKTGCRNRKDLLASYTAWFLQDKG